MDKDGWCKIHLNLVDIQDLNQKCSAQKDMDMIKWRLYTKSWSLRDPRTLRKVPVW